MKKILSLLITLILVLSSLPAFADGALTLDELTYSEYMRGETIIVTGTASVAVNLGLYYPDEHGGSLKFFVSATPSRLASGVEIETDTDPESWPDGTWKIVVQSGELREELYFELYETVDRDEETPTEAPSQSQTGSTSSGNVPNVSIIELAPSSLSLTVGETSTVSITSAASSFTAEVDDKNIASASVSGKTLTVKALKAGSTDIYVKTSNNYTLLNVTVKRSSSSSNPTETETKPVTEPETEPVTEPPTDEPTKTFEDISGHWAENYIITLAETGIINGMSETMFLPNANVTRAQFVTMLQNLYGFTAENEEEIFTDVKKTDWYFSAVSAAYECGIANGYSDGSFDPNALVTRQDMAVFAFRAASKAGRSLALDDSTAPFADDSEISSYAKEAVYSMKSCGIISGMTASTFAPKQTATRAQAARIIYSLFESVNQ